MSNEAERVYRVLVFGKSNVGKSSMINLIGNLSGKDKLEVGNLAHGCTLDSTPVPCTIEGHHFVFYDTAGLNEADCGAVDKKTATRKLIKLLKELRELNLIIYVRKCGVIDEGEEKNLKLINILTGGKVNILWVNTGGENEGNNVNDWWLKNQEDIRKRGHKFDDGVSVFCGDNDKVNRLFTEEILNELRNESKLLLNEKLLKRTMKEPAVLFTNTSSFWRLFMKIASAIWDKSIYIPFYGTICLSSFFSESVAKDINYKNTIISEFGLENGESIELITSLKND